MNLAIKEAWKYQLLTYPNPAVGCVVVGKNQEILSCESHKKAGFAHAEVEALASAYIKLTNDTKIDEFTLSSDIHTYLLENHNNIFTDTTLYVTLEPCSHSGKTPSCANLITQLGIKKVYIAHSDFNTLASGGEAILKNSGVDVEYLISQASKDLLEPFRSFLKGRFIFFKWAQRLNGTFDDGTISSYASRELVHKMRDVCDLLVIGGNSVRIDRPTLDARLIGGKAPDVLIYSKGDDFDRDIPLFHIKNRKVMISDTLEHIKEYKHIIIEGGKTLFEVTKDIVDLYLCFVSSEFGGTQNFSSLSENFKILNIDQVDKDIIMWLKKR